MGTTLILAEDTSGAVAAAGGMMTLVWVAIMVLMIVGWWKMFSKAGQPGWAAIVPIYNVIVMLQIAQKPIWWIVLMFVPVVNFIIMIMVWIGISQRFGKGGGFAAGLILLQPIFVLILAFGSAEYTAAPPQVPAQG